MPQSLSLTPELEGVRVTLPSFLLAYPPHPFPPFPSPPLPPFLPLDVGPLNTARGFGEALAVSSPVRFRAEPQRKSNLVHFSLKI